MRRYYSLLLALATLVSTSSAALAQSVASTPLSAPIEMSGQTGGSQASACGNINPSGGQRVRVTESFASLDFEVESKGNYTLLIRGPGGFEECVFAHNYDGGVLKSPGLLNQGEYRVFVGDRDGASYPYKLSISQ